MVPSLDLLGNAATPDVYVLNSSTDSSAVTPAGLPGGFSPQQISQAYGFNQISFNNGSVKGDGSGQTIAIIDAYSQPNIASDLATFDATYGLAAPPSFRMVNESGGSSLPSSNTNWGLEESLDVEWAHAMAPGANILLVEANSNSYVDLMNAVNYARNQAGVSVVSMSWGGGEWSGETYYDSYFTTPSGHNGVTFVASTGDSGSTGAPEYASVSPNVLAVGGTQLSTDSSGNYLGESGWSGSGGGISAYESRPSYQPSTYSNGTTTATSTMRMVPDVAYNASSGSPYAVYDTSGYGGWIEVYGTSAGAPQWSALTAIADQGRALDGLGTLDGATQTLPALYTLPSSDYHDITSGSNGAYSAGPGYDLVTGLGSPLANQVAAGLVSYGSSTTPQGPWVVTPASATPNPVTGTTTNLSVLGDDYGGASSLTYTWSVLSAPSGVKTPTFSINASNAAQNTTATFYAAGNYTFEATITDSSGLSTTSDVTVTVDQTLTSVTVTPGSATVSDGGTQQFAATAEDQFGNSLSTQPSFTWSIVSGGGTVNSTGLYTAPSTGSGTATVQAAANGVTATASATFGSAPAAPSNLTATVLSTQQVNLTWTDNSSNASNVVVQRSSDDSNWTTLATLAGTAASYSDTSVSGGATYYYRVYADNSYGSSADSNVATVTIHQGPWVATPASATPNPVTGTTTNLSVLGDDYGGASSLTYTWSVLSAPSGVKTPTFSINASNAAQNTTATFYAAGNYTFEATITDSSGLSTTSDVTVTVDQTLTSVTVTPGSATVSDGGTQQFAATAEDQFGNSLSTQPSFTWSITSGGGTVNSTGLYTAPSTGTGTATVQAAAGGQSAAASVTIGSTPAAPSNLTATAVSMQQVNLTWTDNSSNAANVMVQRSLDGSNWTTLATLAGNATAYSDTSVSKSTTYTYRVYADNSLGNSPDSNVATVTTPHSNGGGKGGHSGGNSGGKTLAGQTNAASGALPTSPSDNSLWQQAVDMLWADVNFVDSLLSSFVGLWTHESLA